jgi:DUF1009 family protein
MPKPPDARRLGIIAGGGGLPKRLAEAAAGAGLKPFLLGIAGAAEPETLAPYEYAEVDIAAVGGLIDALRGAGCTEVVLVGKLKRPNFSALRPDWRGIKLLPRVIAAARRGDDALLSTLVAYLEEEGFRVVGADDVFADLVAPLGLIGSLAPTAEQSSDIERAACVALTLGRLDIGQAVVVRDGQVLGVEAAEGTDALIERCGRLQPPGRGGVLAKLAKPGQERRVDLPTIGSATVEKAAAAGLAGVAVEAGGALILDRAAVAAAADRVGLFVVGIARPDGV